jgi:hypothetical protein
VAAGAPAAGIACMATGSRAYPRLVCLSSLGARRADTWPLGAWPVGPRAEPAAGQVPGQRAGAGRVVGGRCCPYWPSCSWPGSWPGTSSRPAASGSAAGGWIAGWSVVATGLVVQASTPARRSVSHRSGSPPMTVRLATTRDREAVRGCLADRTGVDGADKGGRLRSTGVGKADACRVGGRTAGGRTFRSGRARIVATTRRTVGGHEAGHAAAVDGRASVGRPAWLAAARPAVR